MLWCWWYSKQKLHPDLRRNYRHVPRSFGLNSSFVSFFQLCLSKDWPHSSAWDSEWKRRENPLKHSSAVIYRRQINPQINECPNDIPIINVYITVYYWPSCFATECCLRDQCVENASYVLIFLPHLSSQLPSLENDCMGQGDPRGCRCSSWLSFLSGSHCEEVSLFHLSWEPSPRRPRPQLHNTPPHREDHSSGDLPMCGAYAAMHFCRQFINIEKIICFLLKLSSRTIV